MPPKKTKDLLKNSGSSIGNRNPKMDDPRAESLDPSVAIGDPDCPLCSGLGFVGTDVPLGHPEFGKMRVCSCRMGEVTAQQQVALSETGNLGSVRSLTFDSFKVRGRVGTLRQQADILEQAFNTSRHFAGSLQGWLLLMGPVGSGKTHLAAAVANQAVNMGVNTLFLTVPDLLDWLRFAYQSNESSFEKRFEEIRNVPLLVMDDFGTQNATPWAQEKLFQVLNYRYLNKLATVITSNYHLNDFEARLRSRLRDPELVTRVDINAPDYRNPTDDMGHHELSCLNLHSRMIFDSFEPRKGEGILKDDQKSLQDALEKAKAFAANPQGWMVFFGPYGCGKTHLAAAIGNHQTSEGYPPLMVVVPDLLDHLRATFGPSAGTTLDRRFEEIRTSRLLILDDLGTQSATPWAKEKLYQLFNYRYIAELPTVITTANLPTEIDPRLFARMSDSRLCQLVYMSAPPYTGSKQARQR